MSRINQELIRYNTNSAISYFILYSIFDTLIASSFAPKDGLATNCAIGVATAAAVTLGAHVAGRYGVSARDSYRYDWKKRLSGRRLAGNLIATGIATAAMLLSSAPLRPVIRGMVSNESQKPAVTAPQAGQHTP